MSMIGHVRQITPDELLNLQENPSLVRELVKSQVRASTEDMVAAMERVQKIALASEGFLAGPEAVIERAKAQTQILKELESVGVRVPGEPGEEGLSLEKSWHTLHYLLTGKAEEAPAPLGNAILGGTEIGDDLGYGPARFLTPEQVHDIADALNKIALDDLADRFDLDRMVNANIYACQGEEVEWVHYYFSNLVRYYDDAAAKGNAMLLYLR